MLNKTGDHFLAAWKLEQLDIWRGEKVAFSHRNRHVDIHFKTPVLKTSLWENFQLY